MGAHGRRGVLARLPLRVILAGLLVLPLGGMAFYSASLGNVRNREAVAARRTAEQIEVIARLDQVDFVLSGDPTARLGGIAQLLGAKVAGEIDPYRVRIQRQFSSDVAFLVDRRGALDRFTEPGAAARLARRARAVEAMWRTNGRDVHGEQDTRNLVRELLGLARQRAAPQVLTTVEVLDRLGALQSAMLAEVPDLVQGLLAQPRPSTELALRIQARVAEQRILTAELYRLLPRDLAARVREGFAGSDTKTEVRESIMRDAGVSRAGSPRSRLGLATVDIPSLARSYLVVPQVRQELADRLTRSARTRSADAAASLRLVLTASALIALVTGIVVLVIMRSLVTALRAVALRARAIGAGRIDDEPLGISGRGEIARVAASFDELALLLRTLDRQLDALGDGRTGDAVLATPLPGRLGADMQRSVARLSDATRRLQASEQRLADLAMHDHLTGLPNRAKLLAHLDEVLGAGRSDGLAVLFVDLDRFKLVNDGLGHDAGDALLREVAARLRSAVRAEDVVARLGGDEFVVVVHGASEHRVALDLAQRVQQELGQPVDLGGELSVVGASVGVAWADGGHRTGVDLLRDADIAMYRAKQAGRARIRVFDRVMQTSVGARRDLEQALRTALAGDHLEAHVQPIVDLATGQPVMGEVLARWTRKGRPVSPAEFVPVAEESGLVVDLGRWVLRRACALLAQWAPGGFGMRLSVNISGLHVTGGDLAADVTAALRATGADPSRLVIEITESVLVDDPDAAARRLARVRDLGVAIAMDDFGTGYSSLTYLRRLPIEGVKLDRSFVADVGRSASADSIAGMVADLATTLDLWVVGEGVERPEQLDALRRCGLTHGQGFLWSPAVEPDAFVAWCAAVTGGLAGTPAM
ncbi:MAG: EAL domain-containing protein [Actinobacteria bacterium]|nr:EAL domain-containing protein [Actinomycetota bacterium]